MSAVLVATPFSRHPPAADGTILFDAEVERCPAKCLTVLGWYRVGDENVQQLIFKEPMPAREFARSQFFVETFCLAGTRLGAYNASYEAELFGVPVPVELMPRPFAAKEEYIQLETLSTERGRDLPNFAADPGTVCFHNLSCIIKIAILYLGLATYADPGFQIHYEEALRRARS